MAKAVQAVGKELAKDLDEPKVKKIMSELEKSLNLGKDATDEDRIKAYGDLFEKLKSDQEKINKEVINKEKITDIERYALLCTR